MSKASVALNTIRAVQRECQFDGRSHWKSSVYNWPFFVGCDWPRISEFFYSVDLYIAQFSINQSIHLIVPIVFSVLQTHFSTTFYLVLCNTEQPHAKRKARTSIKHSNLYGMKWCLSEQHLCTGAYGHNICRCVYAKIRSYQRNCVLCSLSLRSSCVSHGLKRRPLLACSYADQFRAQLKCVPLEWFVIQVYISNNEVLTSMNDKKKPSTEQLNNS